MNAQTPHHTPLAPLIRLQDCSLRRSLGYIDGRCRALEFGMVAVNRVKITGGPIPCGGWKQSGLGREGSRRCLGAFTELKYLCIDTAA